MQRLEYLVGSTRLGARAIDIFDTDEPAPLMRAAIEVAG
jgi:hypothetical protein